jgi:hypothetical protein
VKKVMAKQHVMRSIVAALMVATAALVAGCPGNLTDEEKAEFQGLGNCPDIPKLFAERCSSAGCHSMISPQANLDLISPNLEGRVVSVAATDNCKNAVLANPIDAEGSILYGKVTDTPPCGVRMPVGEPLSPSEIACVKRWIEGLDPQATATGAGGSGGAGGAGGAGGSGGM